MRRVTGHQIYRKTWVWARVQDRNDDATRNEDILTPSGGLAAAGTNYGFHSIEVKERDCKLSVRPSAFGTFDNDRASIVALRYTHHGSI